MSETLYQQTTEKLRIREDWCYDCRFVVELQEGGKWGVVARCPGRDDAEFIRGELIDSIYHLGMAMLEQKARAEVPDVSPVAAVKGEAKS